MKRLHVAFSNASDLVSSIHTMRVFPFCLAITMALGSCAVSWGQTVANWSLTEISQSGLEIEAEYWLAWTRGSQGLPLVSTSAPGTPRSQAGVLGTSTASILYGDEQFDGGDRSGVRLSAKRNLTDDFAFYGAGLFIGDDNQSGNYFAQSSGLPILSRPFIDATTSAQDAELVAFPNVLSGSVEVHNFSQIVGGEGGLTARLLTGPKGELYALGGYRFISYRDGLSIREDLVSTDLGGFIPLGTTFLVQDNFEATNRFHGGNLGLGVRSRTAQWSYGAAASVAFGSMNRRLNVNGQTAVHVPTQPVDITSGGLLTQPTNIGLYSSNSFAAVPEFKFNLGRRLTDALTLQLGYDFILLPQVWRASEQVDQVVNQSQIGGQPLIGSSRPGAFTDARDTWIQAITFGGSFAW